MFIIISVFWKVNEYDDSVWLEYLRLNQIHVPLHVWRKVSSVRDRLDYFSLTVLFLELSFVLLQNHMDDHQRRPISLILLQHVWPKNKHHLVLCLIFLKFHWEQILPMMHQFWDDFQDLSILFRDWFLRRFLITFLMEMEVKWSGEMSEMHPFGLPFGDLFST